MGHSTENQSEKWPEHDSFWQVYILSVYPTARRHEPKFIGAHGGLQVDKQKVCVVTGSVEWLL